MVFVQVLKGGVDFAGRVRAIECLSLKTKQTPHVHTHPASSHPSNLEELCYKVVRKKASLNECSVDFLLVVITFSFFVVVFLFCFGC